MSNDGDLDGAIRDRMSESGPTRRHLLAVAGGYALAASGVVLPAASEETLAREGVNGGKLGGRHGKNHRSRDKSRNHGDRKRRHDTDNGDKAPGGSLVIKNVALYVYNQRHEAVTVQGWAGGKFSGYHQSSGPQNIPAVEGSTTHFHDFVFDDDEGIVEIAPDHFVWATNTYGLNPRIVIAIGHWGPSGFEGHPNVLVDNRLAVDDIFEGGNIRVQRTVDTSTLKQFYVYLRP